MERLSEKWRRLLLDISDPDVNFTLRFSRSPVRPVHERNGQRLSDSDARGMVALRTAGLVEADHVGDDRIFEPRRLRVTEAGRFQLG